MKILKIFGIVVGIHVFALILIFANPGCSSTSKPAPVPSDTVAKGDSAPPITVSTAPAGNYVSSSTATAPPISPAPAFNPDAPATAVPGLGPVPGLRTTPTRPGTPVAGVLVAEPVTVETPATTYVVKTGDNLWTVAKKNHLTAAELAAANSISTTTVIRPGQKLLIPGKPPLPAAAATAKGAAGSTPRAEPASAAKTRAPDGSLKHVVASGETLGGIARRYEVRAGDIAVANNISDPAKIRAGMELLIPGWQPPGTAKTGKNGTKKSAEARSTPAVEAPTPQPAPPPPVPIIRLEDNPIKPAPKS